MATHQQVHKEGGVFFCTFTCYKWLPLFELGGSYDLVYDWLKRVKSKGILTHGYVIMPNHVHLLISVKKGCDVNMIFSNGKRFIAYAIIKRLNDGNQSSVLSKLQIKSSAGRVRYKAFRLSTDFRECSTDTMVLQKLDYIHGNPVSGKWELSGNYEDYEHSSAGFYSGRSNPLLELIHIDDAMMFE